MGYNDERTLPFMRLKKLKLMNPKELSEGKEVCYYSKEANRLLIGKIKQKTDSNSFLIKCNYRKDKIELIPYQNLNTKEKLLKESELTKLNQGTFYMSHRLTAESLIQRGGNDNQVFEVPEELKIKESDNMETKKIKTKKIKKLKVDFKRKIDERCYREKQSNWNSFKGKTKNKYYNKSKITAKEGSKKNQIGLSGLKGGIHLRNNRIFQRK